MPSIWLDTKNNLQPKVQKVLFGTWLICHQARKFKSRLCPLSNESLMQICDPVLKMLPNSNQIIFCWTHSTTIFLFFFLLFWQVNREQITFFLFLWTLRWKYSLSLSLRRRRPTEKESETAKDDKFQVYSLSLCCSGIHLPIRSRTDQNPRGRPWLILMLTIGITRLAQIRFFDLGTKFVCGSDSE